MKTFLLWHGQSVHAGEEIELPDHVALAYVRTGQAEHSATRTSPPIEAANLDRSTNTATRDMRAPQAKRR